MRKKIISELFENGGLVINQSSNLKIQDLVYQDVVSLFEHYGIILFKDFGIKPERLTDITDRFTESYAADALRRSVRFNEKVIREVDAGSKEVLLHSEASFTPVWPEIIWFYCNTPPRDGGATTLCDGVKLWKALSAKTKDFFLLNPIRFEIEIVVGEKKIGRGKRPWMLNSLGTGNGYIDWDTGTLHIFLHRFAIQEGRVSNQLCFANHLFISPETEPQLIKTTMIDGKQIPKNILEEIISKGNDLTYDHKWKKGELIMIDNKRFMHGRQSFRKNDPRDILVIKSHKASFGYGSTTRNSITNINSSKEEEYK